MVLFCFAVIFCFVLLFWLDHFCLHYLTGIAIHLMAILVSFSFFGSVWLFDLVLFCSLFGYVLLFLFGFVQWCFVLLFGLTVFLSLIIMHLPFIWHLFGAKCIKFLRSAHINGGKDMAQPAESGPT